MDKIESFFKFEITQTTKVLLYKIEKGNNKRWLLEKNEDGSQIILRDLKRPDDNFVTIKVFTQTLHITTAHGFVYVIQDKSGDGAEVSFNGPVNALLAQALMPRMTYVPQTLRAMSSDMDGFTDINEFMERRAQRHNGKVNPQDKFGWRVNMKFNNELEDWLPPFKGGMRDKSAKKSGKFSRK